MWSEQAGAPERSAFTEGVLQVAVGVPVYSLLTLASICVVRWVVRPSAGRRDGGPGWGRGPGADPHPRRPLTGGAVASSSSG